MTCPWLGENESSVLVLLQKPAGFLNHQLRFCCCRKILVCASFSKAEFTHLIVGFCPLSAALCLPEFC
ncbi:hypothetical protein SLEP1_g32252 [Rubroshorea leprosula]|uniref:Uncharacterized protein n=1 Tax=Rubroshorea leprosula TaxID=152421 RepID=A0AAV5KCN3_9ROSI|nr:hypothetical protein SLEP1_g32252 [Rubroshorea leprosula]